MGSMKNLSWHKSLFIVGKVSLDYLTVLHYKITLLHLRGFYGTQNDSSMASQNKSLFGAFIFKNAGSHFILR